MKRSSSKKERRRAHRTSNTTKAAKKLPGVAEDVSKNKHKKKTDTQAVFCMSCNTKLNKEDRVLYVEEEVGRTFCSEPCISKFFEPEIERLERDYFRRLSASDLSDEEKEKYAHLRWVTLEQPDEMWREKVIDGDLRYTLISEFEPGSKKVWCICICLFLRGDPSFLFLAFATKNEAMVDLYRKGERVEWAKKETVTEGRTQLRGVDQGTTDEDLDRYTGDPIQLAENSDFPFTQKCIEETLETPDEVWTSHVQIDGDEQHAGIAKEELEGDEPSESEVSGDKIYHFIRAYSEETHADLVRLSQIKNLGNLASGASSNLSKEDSVESKKIAQSLHSLSAEELEKAKKNWKSFWFIVIAKETDEEDQIELVEAFPTTSQGVVDQYRKGVLEVSLKQVGSFSKLVH